MLEEARLASASSLGLRVNWYLAAITTQESETPVLAWGELHRALTDWADNHGVPSEDTEVVKLAIEGDAGAQAFLTAFVKGTTRLIPGLATRPTFTPRYTGAADDMLAKAEYLYRQHQKVTREDLGDIDLGFLFEAGWCEDAPGELHPPDVYYYGALWPKYDRARARAAEGDAQAERQAKKLLEIIKPAIFDDIRLAPPEPPPPPPGQPAPAVITPPPPSWFPLELLAEWLGVLHTGAGEIELERTSGVIRLKDVDYETMGRGKGTGRTELLQTLGWLNHDKYLFTPPEDKESAPAEGAAQTGGEQPGGIDQKAGEKLDDRRMKLAEAWSRHFVAWAGADPERRTKIEQAYQRAFQGYRTPEYSREPLDIARWYKGVKLAPHQNAGVRRVVANRRGLVAFDTGVGKTYTGLGILAAARQEGWVKRPVLLVPASIIWKWDRDIRRCLPDYRVGIVGSKRKTISRGERQGYETSDTDTPEERARTWRSFQAGEYDVVLMTYESLARTKMRESTVTAYARETAAIERQMTIRRRNLKRQKKLTKREQAVLNQGVAGWVAELLELREKWEYDPGIIWEDLGIDMLIVDEAQNFKNLYMPEARAGGVPKYMGSEGEGSGRAWQLDFRCAAVRAYTGGSGIVLLSATPAKNSPVEFYNLIQLVDHDAWKSIGIQNPEEFIDLFCQIESQDVVNTSTMRYQRESICAGFTNLDMLRSVVFRIGEFKTADEVGLRLPTPTVTIVEVDMTDEQEAKYSEYLDEIADAKAHFQFGRAAGYRMRLPLVAIHVDLDEGYTWPSDAGLQEAPEGVQDPTVATDGVVLSVRGALAIPKKPKRVAGFGSSDPFKVLGLTHKATDEEIRAAYKQLALDHHPDRNPGDAKAHDRFKEINAAHDLIGEPKKRTAWLLQAVAAATEAKKKEKEKRSAAECPNPHSPKFDALVKEIMARPGCGHIVFCDNVAAHWWIRACLIQAGMRPERIAVMNGITAKEVAERQRLAIDFNGDDGDAGDPARGIEPIPPIPPKYDVIIGNAIMHEGVDLQRRTCAIHHLDLPYEPATLQQRNGRGHRQGNKFTEISIFYYFARRSSDGGRYQLIKGKLGWMTALLDSSKRDTNNPGAQSRMSKEEEAIFESRDPAATRALIEAAKAAHQAAVNAKIAHEASATLRGVVERFWRARHPREDEDPVRLRAEAELGLAKLARVSPEAWPWMSWAVHARDVVMLVPLKGESPVYPGLRLAKPNVFDPTVKDFIEFGRVFEGKSIGVRRAGAPTWTELEMDKVVHENIKPEHVAETWQADDDDLIETKMREVMTRLLKGSTAKDTWNKDLAWHWASDAFLERQWARFGAEILAGWVKLPSFWAGDLKVPVLTKGVLSVGLMRPFDSALPPTEAGFAEFMRLALPSKATWGELDEAARFWWGRTIPRNLVAAREKPEKPAKAAA
jgi:DnaJ-domain-containing protein 1